MSEIIHANKARQLSAEAALEKRTRNRLAIFEKIKQATNMAETSIINEFYFESGDAEFFESIGYRVDRGNGDRLYATVGTDPLTIHNPHQLPIIYVGNSDSTFQPFQGYQSGPCIFWD